MPGVKDQTDGSDYSRRIAIQAVTYTQVGRGKSETWNTVYSCWANKADFPHGRGLSKAFKFSQLYPTANTTFQIRFQLSTPLDDTMRVQYIAHGVTHIYQILGIENPNEANVSLWLMCQEQQVKSEN
jgi:hypothetical protein